MILFKNKTKELGRKYLQKVYLVKDGYPNFAKNS